MPKNGQNRSQLRHPNVVEALLPRVRRCLRMSLPTLYDDDGIAAHAWKTHRTAMDESVPTGANTRR